MCVVSDARSMNVLRQVHWASINALLDLLLHHLRTRTLG